MSEDTETQEEQGGGGPNPILAVVLALLVAGGGGTYYFYNQYQSAQKQLQEAQAQLEAQPSQSQVQTLVEDVGKLMELPQGEAPTVASIRDTEKIKDHPFLSKGQQDDKLLIYTGSKIAIMYRPSTNKIVAVGTVQIQEGPQGSAQPTVRPQASPSQ